jgi:phospholipase C
LIISVVNRSNKVDDEHLQCVIRAINRQIREDFEPYWSFGAQLRLEGKIGTAPDKQQLAELRGDAVIYLWDEVDVQGALGYHAANLRGIPYGFVFIELARELGENWTVTLSHEALELVGDAQGNLLVQGPHPAYPAIEVFHWFEMCDAVQAQTYKIDGIEVANFLLPLYFTLGEQEGGRNDFLGRLSDGNALPSFGVAAGGYIGFYNPATRRPETYSAPGDGRAQQRLQLKRKHLYGRGYMRSRQPVSVARETAHARALQASPAKASSTAPNDPIKHVVVLMLENRSFDHMLGGMTKIDPNVEGARPNQPFSNTAPDGTRYEHKPGAKWVVDKKRDLDHEHLGAMQQIGDLSSPMGGFVSTYLARYPDATKAELDEVMSYFEFGDKPETDTLPALHALARNFAVCDHWFSSLPGPTWQNRFFLHSGTCLGHLRMPSSSHPEDMHVYYQDTIFDRLHDSGVSWRIYHHGVPQSIVLTRQLKRWVLGQGYADMSDFFNDAAGPAADFPEYVCIEPCYFGHEENDQHPPADVRDGDALIAGVYNALRSNAELWSSTLLIVTYDEHGGFYDHVPPPATVPPDAFTAEWSFDRLGIRVPTILVSPWIQRRVIKTVFDHTSVLRYLYEKWNLAPLEARTQPGAGAMRANTFGPELTKLEAPRQDAPAALPVVQKPHALALAAAEPPIEGSREALLIFAEQLPEPGAGAARAMTARGQTLKAAAKPSALVSGSTRVNAALKKLERLRGVTQITDARGPQAEPGSMPQQ